MPYCCISAHLRSSQVSPIAKTPSFDIKRAAEDLGPYHRKDSVGTQTITPHRRENVL